MATGKSKEHIRVVEIILTALMIALVFIAGSIVKIPTLHGFVQPGDCMVLISGILLGKKKGFLAGAIGMALVDLGAGFPLWAPFTFVIKGLMALTVAVLIERVGKPNITKYIIIFIIAGIVNLIGYFIANAIMGGIFTGAATGIWGSIIYAAEHFIGDSVEVIFGIVIAIPLAPIANRLKKSFLV